MAVNYNFKKGIDIPAWQWLPPFTNGPSYHGSSNAYDGKRFQYWAVQTGTTATTSSTTVLYRYDMWSNGWQYLATLTSGNTGVDIEYDSIRNLVYVIIGANTTTWQVFNLNNVAVTVANTSCPAFSLTTMPLVLPSAASYGGSLTMPSDDVVPSPIDTGIADSVGQSTTTVNATVATGSFGQGMVNLQLRVTSGTQSGQIRTISAVTSSTSMTVTPALPGALAAGDTYVIEQVEDILTGGSTTTATDTTANWTVNGYANMDIIITTGTGAGQRRRIASNTATVITLAGAVTGNARTGPFTTAPDSTSRFKIVPSSDFLYYQPGTNNTSLYRIDIAQTTGAAWSASLALAPGGISGGGNTFYPAAYAPYQILAFRGNGTANVYMYNIGTNSWTTIATYAGSETFNTGASAAMISGKRKLIIQKETTTRLYILDLLTGFYEPGPTIPYASGGAYDGKRARVITTPDGAQFLYILRPGGQEFFRVPLEWL